MADTNMRNKNQMNFAKRETREASTQLLCIYSLLPLYIPAVRCAAQGTTAHFLTRVICNPVEFPPPTEIFDFTFTLFGRQQRRNSSGRTNHQSGHRCDRRSFQSAAGFRCRCVYRQPSLAANWGANEREQRPLHHDFTPSANPARALRLVCNDSSRSTGANRIARANWRARPARHKRRPRALKEQWEFKGLLEPMAVLARLARSKLLDEFRT